MRRSAKITAMFFLTVAGLLALCGSARATEGPISYWRFDEGSGNIAYDSANGNHGTIYGATRTTGIVGGALSFDGVDDYVSIAGTASLNPRQHGWTAEIWLKTTQKTSQNDYYVRVMGRTNDPMPESRWILRTTMGHGTADDPRRDAAVLQIFDGITKSATAVGTTTVTDGVWHHLAFVYDYDNSASYIYRDGIIDGLSNWAGIPVGDINPTVELQIGQAHYPTEFYRGLIDEVAIFNRALTVEEIQQHYWNGSHGQGYLAIEVPLDIKPGSYPNAINLGSKGLIPVVILSSEDFVATQVDPAMVTLAGAGVAVRGKADRTMAHEEDVNEDGLVDLVVQIVTENLDPESFQDGYAVLTGTTYGGLRIWGADEIIIVPQQQ